MGAYQTGTKHDSVLQLWPVGTQRMRQDHAPKMHCGNFENIAGSHHRAGEAPGVPWSWRAGEDGGLHASGTNTSLNVSPSVTYQ